MPMPAPGHIGNMTLSYDDDWVVYVIWWRLNYIHFERMFDVNPVTQNKLHWWMLIYGLCILSAYMYRYGVAARCEWFPFAMFCACCDVFFRCQSASSLATICWDGDFRDHRNLSMLWVPDMTLYNKVFISQQWSQSNLPLFLWFVPHLPGEGC